MSDKTRGEKVWQWLVNARLFLTLFPLISALGFGTLYGTSDAVKDWVDGTQPVVVTPEVEPVKVVEAVSTVKPVNYDKQIKALNKRFDNLESTVREWHE